MNYLLLNGNIQLDQLLEDTGVKRDVVIQLQNREIIKLYSSENVDEVNPLQRTTLTAEQSRLVTDILNSKSVIDKNANLGQVHLLYGPTGSGKLKFILQQWKIPIHRYCSLLSSRDIAYRTNACSP